MPDDNEKQLLGPPLQARGQNLRKWIQESIQTRWSNWTLVEQYLRQLTGLEFVTGGVELLKAVLHGYAGGLIFMK